MTAALCAQELSVRHGEVLALDRVSLTVDPGEIVGLIGPNGAGKTTFIDAVTGFTPCTHGTVRLGDTDLSDLRPAERATAGLSRTFQSGELFDGLSVRDHVALGAGGARRGGLARDLFRPAPADPDLEPILERFGLSEVGERRPDQLSQVDRQMVGLARAVAGRPSVVVLDEPSAGLDRADTERMAAAIRELAEQGTSVVLVDHDMSLVMTTCDRIDVLDLGRIIASGTPDRVRHDPVVLDAYLGGAP